MHKGDLPMDIKWTLNGKTVDNLDGISVLRTNKRISQLSIDSVSAEHAGEYLCLAKNKAGVFSNKAYLHVNGRRPLF